LPCSKCKNNPAVPGKGWCRVCYDSRSKNNSNNNNNNNSNNNNSNNSGNANTNNAPKDFTRNKVKFSKADDNSARPLDWSNNKLLAEKRCLYCAEHMHGHASPSCKEKYEYYGSLEVRTLLRAGVVVPGRGSVPTGPPISP
jgi:hypothetical protein